MEVGIAALMIFALAFAGLAIGVIFKRACIKGSCGGSIQTSDGGGCRCGRYTLEKLEKRCEGKGHAH